MYSSKRIGNARINAILCTVFFTSMNMINRFDMLYENVHIITDNWHWYLSYIIIFNLYKFSVTKQYECIYSNGQWIKKKKKLDFILTVYDKWQISI